MNYKKANLQLGTRDSRKLDNNTYLQRREIGAIAIMLHSTDIITFNPDGTTVLNSGGWKTVTTKTRMNDYLPFNLYISQANYIWSIGGKTYSDGMIIGKRGGLQGTAKKKQAKQQENDLKVIKKYVKGYMSALINLEIDAPSGGDCWYCALKTKEGKTIGELSDNSHLYSHFEERYYVPSLLVNAVQQYPVSIIAEGLLHELIYKKENEYALTLEQFLKDQVGKSLQKYLKKHLL